MPVVGVHVLTVGELAARIRDRLEGDPALLNIWVKGEISNLRTSASGHLYFTLKDAAAAIRVVLFRGRAGTVDFPLANGVAVVLRGSVGFYENDGSCRIYAAEVFRDGVGKMYAGVAWLWQKLGQEGLFDPAAKKPLPPYPRRIGIITSPSGAALADMLRVLRERWPVAEVLLAPVAVQGEAAPSALAAALRLLDLPGFVDVIIIGRGGGTMEELAPFNTEAVARAIHACRVPVVAAVGHEGDVTLADMVADTRAATPSHAAAMVAPDRREVARVVASQTDRLLRAMALRLGAAGRELGKVLERRICLDPIQVLVRPRSKQTVLLARRLTAGLSGLLQGKGRLLENGAGRLDLLSPLRVLARGYSICARVRDGRIVRHAGEVDPGELLHVAFYRGRALCRVESRECEEVGDRT